jgi:FixJ family two-component response regulator
MEEAVVAGVHDEPSGRDSLSSAAGFSRLMSWVTSLADGLLERGILSVSRCFICAICIAGLDGLEVKHQLPPAFPETTISFISGHHGDDL